MVAAPMFFMGECLHNIIKEVKYGSCGATKGKGKG